LTIPFKSIKAEPQVENTDKL